MNILRLVVAALFWTSIVLNNAFILAGRIASERKTTQRQCELPTIKNGMARIRNRGKLIRFQCIKSYTLIGSTWAGCSSGKWDSPIPVCAKNGCSAIKAPENGIVMTENGILTRLFCKDHYAVAGGTVTYCDGANWDRPLGNCRSTNDSSPKWCDFEVEDMCGWTHDELHDFEWKRVLGGSVLRRVRSGPQFDHTTMTPNSGHYMLVESVNQQLDDKARLISPIYPAKLSNNACFRFYYHMYGATVGTLRVYIKPISVDMETILEDARYLFFEISGNQKNLWKENVIFIENLDEDFQIIFEGTTGVSHLSDIAIDDVALLHDQECPNEEFRSTNKPEIEETGGVYDIQSCKNRCTEKSPQDEQLSTKTINGGIIKSCDCHPECEDAMSCCSDYRNLCSFGDTDDDNTADDALTTDKSSQISENIEYIGDKNESTTAFYDQNSTVYYTTKRTIMETTTKSRRIDFDKSSSISKVYSSSTGTVLRPKYEYPITTEFTTTTTRTTHVFTTTSDNNFVNDNKVEGQAKWILDSISDRAVIPTWAIILLSTILAAIIISIAGLLLNYYRKNYGPDNYKKNAEVASRNANEEFSEIRYLTSDEHLDFTLQTPETINSSPI